MHASTMRADALGTGLTGLGFEKAWALAQREQLGGLFILRHGDKLEVRATPHWPEPGKRD
jgi:thiamine biosynthesis lipoprotein ApbE